VNRHANEDGRGVRKKWLCLVDQAFGEGWRVGERGWARGRSWMDEAAGHRWHPRRMRANASTPYDELGSRSRRLRWRPYGVRGNERRAYDDVGSGWEWVCLVDQAICGALTWRWVAGAISERAEVTATTVVTLRVCRHRICLKAAVGRVHLAIPRAVIRMEWVDIDHVLCRVSQNARP